jgi:hypothetical protein
MFPAPSKKTRSHAKYQPHANTEYLEMLTDASLLAAVDFQDDFRALQGFSGPCRGFQDLA